MYSFSDLPNPENPLRTMTRAATTIKQVDIASLLETGSLHDYIMRFWQISVLSITAREMPGSILHRSSGVERTESASQIGFYFIFSDIVGINELNPNARVMWALDAFLSDPDHFACDRNLL